MTKTIVNLMIPTLNTEIAKILETYPNDPHQRMFANPDLRQELLTYVLRHVPGHYMTVETAVLESTEFKTLELLGEEREQIHKHIHQGIRHILEQSDQETDHHGFHETYPSDNSCIIPSHWFG